MDETYVARDSQANNTIEALNSKKVFIKTTSSDKENYSIMLAIFMIGDKLPVSVILKRKGVRNQNLILPENRGSIRLL